MSFEESGWEVLSRCCVEMEVIVMLRQFVASKRLWRYVTFGAIAVAGLTYGWQFVYHAFDQAERDRAIAHLHGRRIVLIYDRTSPAWLRKVTGERIADLICRPRVFGITMDVSLINKMHECRKDRLITDADMKYIAVLRNIEYANLSGCAISDLGLCHLTRLLDLEELYLDNTNISDAGLASLSALTKLRHLRVNGTRVTAAGVRHLQALMPKCEIERSLIVGVALASQSRSEDNDLDAMQGTWKMIHLEYHGGVVQDIDGIVLNIEGNTWTLVRNGPYAKGVKTRFRIFPEESPKAFECQLISDTGEVVDDGVIKGIYSIEGNTLKRCHGNLGEGRPLKFETKAGVAYSVLSIFERQLPAVQGMGSQ